MTNSLHWRMMRWGLALWGGYVMLWTVTVGPGVAIAILWWVTGMIVFGALWLVTQPWFRRRPSTGGVVVRPGWTDWRFLDVHRTHRPGAQRHRRTPGSRSDALQPPEQR